MLSIIVAMDQNRVIGFQNQLPWHIPEDLARLKQMTMGKTIVMGRRTFESIGHPLKGRHNVVVSNDAHFQSAGIEIVDSVQEIIERYQQDEAECFIFGGASIYQQALPYVSRLYLTCIDATFLGDSTFPEINMNDWVTENEVAGNPDARCPFSYKFVTLQRRIEYC